MGDFFLFLQRFLFSPPTNLDEDQRGWEVAQKQDLFEFLQSQTSFKDVFATNSKIKIKILLMNIQWHGETDE